MRTLSTQVKLRRLVRTFGEVVERLESEPRERRLVGPLVDRLLELSEDVAGSWAQEAASGRLAPALRGYVAEALRTAELAIAGLRQAGADLELLRSDFEAAELPLEVFMRGLDEEPALQRSA